MADAGERGPHGAARAAADAGEGVKPYAPPRLPLRLLAGRLAVARLDPDAPIPAWALDPAPLVAIARTRSELSILTDDGSVPDHVRAERGWRALEVRGPLPFDLVGILASLVQPLAEARLGIFALSTYDTDYVLVKQGDLDRAVAALRVAGHTVDGA